ncbi:MAG: hypothetical protein ACK5UT_20645 [Acidobacteriota bacterium]|jgi:hypothetical protein
MLVIDPVLSPELRIWRYLTLPAYLDFLTRQALYFSSVESLHESDPWEGALWPQHHTELRQALSLSPEAAKDLSGHFERVHRPLTFVCCWHQNEFESAAMWDLYSQREGVAIQSTLGSLTHSFPNLKEGHVRPVQYVEPDSENQAPINFTKRPSFRHEQELRIQAVLVGPDLRGEYADVNISALVQSVYVNPKAKRWVADAIASTTEKLNFRLPIIHSSLYSPR